MVQIPIARRKRDNKIVWINDVEKDKKEEYICLECKEQLIPCQGEIKDYYFRHKISNSTCCGSCGEGYEHGYSKNLIADYLNDGKPIYIERNCYQCNCKYTIILKIENGGRAIPEFHLSPKERVDIAILDATEKCSFVIEIKKTHATESRSVNWCELNANTIINEIEKKKSYIFSDLRHDVKHEYDGYRPCLTLKQLALKLGYLEIINVDSKDTESLFNDMKNFPENNIVKWNTKGKSEDMFKGDELENLRKNFKIRKRCLYCEKKVEWNQELTFSSGYKQYKTYCSSCFKKIRFFELKEKFKSIAPNYQELISKIPLYNDGLPCFFCGKEVKKTFIFWK